MTSPEITREVTGRGTRATFAAALRASTPALSSAAVLVSGPVILIAVWWVAFAFELVDKNPLPSPFATLADTWTNIVSGNLLEDFWFTFQRVAYAFLFTTFAGVPVGIVLGVNERVYRSVEFIIDFFRSTPATAMFPLFLLLFGLGDFSNTRHLVRAAGLDPDEDVTLVDLAVPQQVPAVLGGSVDATLSLEPVGSIAAATDGVDRVVINPVAKVIADPSIPARRC